MYGPKRPHAKEDEEEILELQREFLEAKNMGVYNLESSSAKVTRIGSTQETSIPTLPPKPKLEPFFVDPTLPLEVVVKEDIVSTDLVQSILQKIDLTPITPAAMRAGRDKLIRSNLSTAATVAETAPTKKKSLFARSAEERNIKNKNICQNDVKVSECKPQPGSSIQKQEPQPGPSISESAPEGVDFHPLCAGMSQEEIRAEAKKLEERLDPKLVEFVRKRTSAQPDKPATVAAATATPAPSSSTASLQELPIDPETVKRFPHMDKVESDKLEWTLPPGQGAGNTNNLPIESGGGLNARFDFAGELVSESRLKSDETWSQGLHHHGEEMERPGYTLGELLTLGRSTNLQQRAVAFETLTVIFENNHFGIFDHTLDKSLFYLWSEMDCVYVVRKGLDETDAVTINSALSCLAAMLYSLHEEMSLDSSYLWPDTTQPWILVTPKEKRIPCFPSTPGSSEEEEREEDLKDVDVCGMDLIEFLVTRSALLRRLDFLMRKKSENLNEGGTLGILKILIRVARHSPTKVLEFEDLLKYIAKSHVNSNWSLVGKSQRSLVGKPLALALKLFRILIDSSPVNARTVFSKFDLLPAILSYLAYDQWLEQSHVKDIEFLVLESFKVWRAFLSHGFGLEEYSSFFGVFMKYLNGYQRRDFLTPFDLNHAAHLFSLFSKILELSTETHSHWTIVKDAVTSVALFLVKLLAQLSDDRTREMCDDDLSLAALEQGLKLISIAKKYESFPAVTKALDKFLQSSGYTTITSQLINHSFIIMKVKPEDAEKEAAKYPTNFSVCGATMFGGRLNPILRQKTPFPVLITISRFQRIEKNPNLLNSDITKYFQRVLTSKHLFQESVAVDNFFLRYELFFIAEILEALPNFNFEFEFELLYKLVPIIQKCDTELFGRLLKLCLKSLGKTQTQLESGQVQTQSSFDEHAAGLFLKTLLTEVDEKKGQRGTDLLFQTWKGKVIKSKHWILEPFHIWYDFYSKLETESQTIYATDLQAGVKLVLELINFVLSKSEAGGKVLLSTPPDVLMLYSRISLCFLMGYELFLDPQIRELLGAILKKLGNNSILLDQKQAVFVTPYPDDPFRSSTFETLYSDLLVEFGATSFGDEVFAGYILLPLRFAEGPSLKMKFMAGDITRYFRFTEEKSIIPLSYFTAMKEENPNVLAIFVTALRSGQVTEERQPFLYNILRFHVLECKK